MPVVAAALCVSYDDDMLLIRHVKAISIYSPFIRNMLSVSPSLSLLFVLLHVRPLYCGSSFGVPLMLIIMGMGAASNLHPTLEVKDWPQIHLIL